MDKLEATFRIVTPMFMGGANQDKAELRVPSIKAALRFWYRAIDPEYKENEARIFGGSGDKQGQAIFLLRLQENVKGQKWDRNSISCPFSSNQKTLQLNGIRYLGFSLFMGDNTSRQAIPAGTKFTIKLIFKRQPDEQDRKRIVAALWLLGHFGSLGTRSRRGFGVLSLQSLNVTQGDQWPELDNVQLAQHAENTQEWLNRYTTMLQEIKEWFPGTMDAEHTVFSNNTKICLADTVRMKGCQNKQKWEYALDTAGKIMQEFRQRWDLKQPDSDYFAVKKHICNDDERAAEQMTGLTPAALSKIPERTSFGLPLQFRYSSLKYEITKRNGNIQEITPGLLFEGGDKKHPRSASRIWVRIAEIGNEVYPVFIRMDGPLLAPGDSIMSKGKKISYHAQPDDDILNTFWSSFSKIQELEWRNV